jgi:SAM-dependent methyltransferase
MTANVLRSRDEIVRARAELRRRDISCLSSYSAKLLRKVGLLNGLNIGDDLKSWDILKTVQFIEEKFPTNTPILDIGSCGGEFPLVLHRLKYTEMTCVDLDPKINLMPNADSIRYEVSDFMQTPFRDESFAAITAISVIEHGFNSQRLLKEVSRLLRPGGYFIASFDYWPEKVDTRGVQFFGLDWRIFSEQEVLDFVREAGQFNLAAEGSLDLSADEKPIACAGQNYTFAWLVLKKRDAAHM